MQSDSLVRLDPQPESTQSKSQEQAEIRRQIEEFLKNGNDIEVLPIQIGDVEMHLTQKENRDQMKQCSPYKPIWQD